MLNTTDNMKYNYLGNTGLRVSCISYGFCYFDDQGLLDDMLPRACKFGINYIDCSESYGWEKGKFGAVEELLGNSLKKLDIEREDLVLSTKLMFGGLTPNKIGLSYKHIVKGMETSLKRMQLYYVDVVFAHREDTHTPMEEICRGFNQIIEEGNAFYWATSEWAPDRVMEAFAVCDRLGLIRPVADQAVYNLLVRQKMEKDFVNLFENYGYGAAVWGALAGGILTGKYNEEPPEDCRLATDKLFKSALGKYTGSTQIQRESLRKVADISNDIGCSMAQLALAWTLKNKDVSSAIIGATKPTQLEENMKALEIVDKITVEVEEKIDKALGNRPDPGLDYRTWTPLKPRRMI